MTKHKLFSLIKSAVRLAGFALGAWAFRNYTPAVAAFYTLFLAELIGVIEEEFE